MALLCFDHVHCMKYIDNCCCTRHGTVLRRIHYGRQMVVEAAAVAAVVPAVDVGLVVTGGSNEEKELASVQAKGMEGRWVSCGVQGVLQRHLHVWTLNCHLYSCHMCPVL